MELAPRTAAPARAAGWARAGDFLSFVKPHIDVTFVAVAVAGAVVAWHWSGPFPLSRVLILAGSVALLSAGAECWTNIRDRDLDAVMPRTQGRPLVSGRISLLEALLLAVVLTGLGLVLAALLGPVALAFLAFALLSNVVVYSVSATLSDSERGVAERPGTEVATRDDRGGMGVAVEAAPEGHPSGPVPR